MRKKHDLLILSLSLLTILSGCSFSESQVQETAVPWSPIQAPAAASPSAAPVESETVSEEMPEETFSVDAPTYDDTFLKENTKLITQFLDHLKNADDPDALYNSLGNYNGSYDFLKDVKLNSYSMTLLQDHLDQRYTDCVQYEVTLDIAKSSDPIFPAGTSKWLIAAPSCFSEIALFIPMDKIVTKADEENPDLPAKFSDYSQLYNEATWFSHIMQCFDTQDTPLDQMALAASQYHRLMHHAPLDEQGRITLDALNAYIQGTYGLSADAGSCQDFMAFLNKRQLLETDGQTIDVASCGHGDAWYMTSLEKVTTSSSDEVTLDVNYYGDCCCFYPVKKVSYTFKQSNDNTWQLSQVKTLEDKGYFPQDMGV